METGEKINTPATQDADYPRLPTTYFVSKSALIKRIILFSAFWIYIAFKMRHDTFDSPLIVPGLIVLLILNGFMIGMGVLSLLFPQPVFAFMHEGIFLEKQKLLVRWQDIASAIPVGKGFSRQIGIMLKEPQKYREKMTGRADSISAMLEKTFGTPVVLNASYMGLETKTVCRWVNHFCGADGAPPQS